MGAWYPYYAGFSTAFALKALRELNLKRGAVAGDLMVGSGTTTVAAQLLGHDYFAIELNPVLAIIAAAKSARLASQETTRAALSLLDLVAAESPAQATPPVPKFARKWFMPGTWHALHQCMSAGAPLHDNLDEAIAVPTNHPGTLLQAAALMAARALASRVKGTNPTWPKAGAPRRHTRSTVLGTVRSHIMRSSADLAEELCTPKAKSSSGTIMCGHALEYNDEEGYLDAIVSSPPYLTRIDYSASTAPELAVLPLDGLSKFGLRHRLMGSTLSRREIAEHWQMNPQVRRVVLQARAHPSKDSSGYYHGQFKAYFNDSHRFCQQIDRSLSERGQAIIVVQDSWYKDIRIPLGDLYVSMLEGAGLRAKIVKSELAARSLVQVNSSARVAARNPVHEHVIHAQKTGRPLR